MLVGTASGYKYIGEVIIKNQPYYQDFINILINNGYSTNVIPDEDKHYLTIQIRKIEKER